MYSRTVTRRAFLSAAATLAAGSALLRLPALEAEPGMMLHVAVREADAAAVHTYFRAGSGLRHFCRTVVDQLVTIALHPGLPILYAARDCALWRELPRGVVETYEIGRPPRPLRLLAQMPMALSATGPRSIAVSAGGEYLLISASRGGAWNVFPLAGDGMPETVAVARKETGSARHGGSELLPMPHGAAFSPHGLLAAGADVGCGRLTLMQPTGDAIAVLGRCPLPRAAAAVAPVWTRDGRHIITAGANALHCHSLHTAANGAVRVQQVAIASIGGPAVALAAHPSRSGVLVLRPRGQDAMLEAWRVSASGLQIEQSLPLVGRPHTLTSQGSGVWVATSEHIRYLSLRGPIMSFGAIARTPRGTVLSMAAPSLSA